MNADLQQHSNVNKIIAKFGGVRQGFTIKKVFQMAEIDCWFLVQKKEIMDFKDERATVV